VGVCRYVTEQSFVSSNYQLVNFKGCVTQGTFKSFTEEGIKPFQVGLSVVDISCESAHQCMSSARSVHALDAYSLAIFV